MQNQSIDCPLPLETDSADNDGSLSAALIYPEDIRAEERKVERKTEDHPPWCNCILGKDCDCDVSIQKDKIQSHQCLKNRL